MRDRREDPTDDAPRETGDGEGENTSRVLSVSHRELLMGLALSDSGTNYAALFTRLQKLIDNATKTIRDLRRENAELSGQVSQMDAYIQLRADAVGNEAELHKAAVRLEEELAFESVAVAQTHPTPVPLHRVYELAPAPESRYETPANGHPPARETPREAPPAPPAPVTFAAPVAPPPAPVQRAPVAMPTVPLFDASATREAPHAAPVVAPPASGRYAEPPVYDDEAEARTVVFAPPALLAPPVAGVTPAPEAVRELVAPAPVAAVRHAPVAPLAPLSPMASDASERHAGTYTLVVYPFTRFSDLGQFQSALRELVGIHDVQVRRFAQGTLEMRLSYDGQLSLPQMLRELPIRVEAVEEEEPYRLRVRLDLNNGP